MKKTIAEIVSSYLTIAIAAAFFRVLPLPFLFFHDYDGCAHSSIPSGLLSSPDVSLDEHIAAILPGRLHC